MDKLKYLFLQKMASHGHNPETILVAWEQLVEWAKLNNKNLIDHL